jgi:hypothetical protein
MPGIIEFPTVVEQALKDFGDLFGNEPARRHLAEYLTGLLVAERLCCTKGKLRARKSAILNVWQKENQPTASATGASITNRWSNGAV